MILTWISPGISKFCPLTLSFSFLFQSPLSFVLFPLPLLRSPPSRSAYPLHDFQSPRRLSSSLFFIIIIIHRAYYIFPSRPSNTVLPRFYFAYFRSDLCTHFVCDSTTSSTTTTIMPTMLLPASAAAFAPRSAPNVVLNTKVEPWLTATLKRINRIKRPLNSVPQHTRCLTETLSSSNAIWTLCSIMLPKAPNAELRKDSNPLVEALFNFQLLHMEAYVVHVDMVSRNEVAFKLTPETIESLVEHHKEIFQSIQLPPPGIGLKKKCN